MLESMGSMQRVRHNLVTEQQQRIDIRDTEYIFPPDMFSSSAGKEPTCNAGDPSSIPGSVRYPGEGIGYPLQYSCLGNLMNRGAWGTTVHGMAKSWT